MMTRHVFCFVKLSLLEAQKCVLSRSRVCQSKFNSIIHFLASGLVEPPTIINLYKQLPSNIASSVPEHCGIGVSDIGWMMVELFYEYMSSILNKYLIEKKYWQTCHPFYKWTHVAFFLENGNVTDLSKYLGKQKTGYGTRRAV